MTYLIWQNSNGWLLSRPDGRIDEYIRHSGSILSIAQSWALEAYCQENGLKYEVKPTDRQTKGPELTVLNKYVVT